MLHAELHGKLSSDIGDGVERLEDVLTSTVFGTLFAASAWEVIVEWFGRARRGSEAPPSLAMTYEATNYWFWPWLDNAEPDIVLQLGASLVLVEAKYLSGKSGSPKSDGDDASSDQLVREWRAIGLAANHAGYDPALRDLVTASTTRRILLYLVRRSRIGREGSELAISLRYAPGASMYLLTWEDLDEVLASRLHLRWANDLHRYLEHRRVAAFRGFAEAFPSAPSGALRSWRQHRAHSTPSFVDLMPQQPAIALLARHPPMFTRAYGYSRAIRAETTHLLQELATRPSRFREH